MVMSWFQWMKVDELIEQERQVKSAMSSRAGVMALLLHSTFNHEVVSVHGFQNKQLASGRMNTFLKKLPAHFLKLDQLDHGGP